MVNENQRDTWVSCSLSEWRDYEDTTLIEGVSGPFRHFSFRQKPDGTLYVEEKHHITSTFGGLEHLRDEIDAFLENHIDTSLDRDEKWGEEVIYFRGFRPCVQVEIDAFQRLMERRQQEETERQQQEVAKARELLRETGEIK